MRPIVLIAINFAREQLWPLFFLLLWVLGWAAFGLFGEPQAGAQDALMIFKQLAAYSVAFSVFFGSSAIRTDQRSRRILAVLSKAVSRRQYILGLLLGIAMVLGGFCLCLGFTATWALGGFGLSVTGVWSGILGLATACLLTASLTLFLSTFLPPVFAAIGSGLIVGLLALRGGTPTLVFPVYALLQPLLDADFGTVWFPRLGVLALAWLEILLLWVVASWIFSRRDLAVATE